MFYTFSNEQLQVLLQHTLTTSAPLERSAATQRSELKLLKFSGSKKEYQAWRFQAESKLVTDWADLKKETQVYYIFGRLEGPVATQMTL